MNPNHFYPYPYPYPYADYYRPPQEVNNEQPEVKIQVKVELKNEQGQEVKIKSKAQIQKMRRKKMNSKYDSNKIKGRWTPQEKKKYHVFLQTHSVPFMAKKLRRIDKIFRTMSYFVGTRTPQQCRSHHQKLQKRHGSYQQIIKTLRIKFYSSSDHLMKGIFLNMQNLQMDQHLDDNFLKTKQLFLQQKKQNKNNGECSGSEYQIESIQLKQIKMQDQF